ncbi:hypothetical protein CEXT_396631 [Caerostris extrusa]|uniref:Uncharacterized protein n=1 Tax=Caerostris extrusa TaxID=172846 RepID=A0AAV4N6Z3_CAEEX|nr:hypothetical protein CEXT_396631 [Caerostris extrusa]
MTSIVSIFSFIDCISVLTSKFSQSASYRSHQIENLADTTHCYSRPNLGTYREARSTYPKKMHPNLLSFSADLEFCIEVSQIKSSKLAELDIRAFKQRLVFRGVDIFFFFDVVSG